MKSDAIASSDQSLIYPFAASIAQKYGCDYLIDFLDSESHNGGGFKVDLAILTTMKNKFLPFARRGSPTLSRILLKKSIIICRNIDDMNLIDKLLLLAKLKVSMNYAPISLITARDINSLKNVLAQFRLNTGFMGFSIDGRVKKDGALAIVFNNNQNLCINKSELDRFKIIGIMAIYNEEDIIYHSVMKLVNQGIDVYIMDNWSTDSTYQIVKELLSKGLIIGCERYPPQGPSENFDLGGQLTRKMELAQELRADWFINCDADEIRMSPWNLFNLKEAILIVDKMGFNAIDFTVIEFRPIDDGFDSNYDFEDYFKYFEFSTLSGHFVEVKVWKHLNQPIEIVSSGGHMTLFEGQRVFPFKFLLKHYPFRSQKHGMKKLFVDRIPRYGQEKKLGWHTHYDGRYERGCSFLSPPGKMIYFDRKEFSELYLLERLSGIGIIAPGLPKE